MTVRIGTSTIGEQGRVFIIAEAGVNHNGRLDLALKLAAAAKEAGADAVKFQNFKPEEVVTKTAGTARYQKKNTGKEESQLSMIRRFALSTQDLQKIAAYCKNVGIMFLSAPHGGFDSVDELRDIGVPAIKFSSADLTNLPTLSYAAKLKKPIILSTGMATLQDIRAAVRAIQKAGGKKIIILQCTTNYPTHPEEVNLNVLHTLSKAFKLPVGFSDHTVGSQAAIMAVTLGASVIEKHFTLDRTLPGPDHAASAEPHELTEYIAALRLVSSILGSAEKRPTRSEKEYMPLVRKSVVARRPIAMGEIFSRENLAIKRPGTGLHPGTFDQLLGKRAKRHIKEDELLTKNDL